MSYHATVYNVMVASPSDVSAERGIIREVIHEWNTINSTSRNIVLLPIGWESHSSPEMGDTAQNIINKQVLDKSDVLVGVFWTRIGTPTDEYQSGSVEEIEKHIKTGKLTMLYFSSKPVALDSVDHNQYNELTKFKESCKTRGLYESYDDLSEFKDKFYRHLQLKLNEHEMFIDDNQDKTSEIRQSTVPIPMLTVEAKMILKEMSIDTNGQLLAIRAVTGTSIATNGKPMNATQEPREIAKLKGAIQSLQQEGLIQKTGSKNGEVYTITDLGYSVADTL